MKLLKSIVRTTDKTIRTDKEFETFYFVSIDTLEEAEIYREVSSKIMSKQAINLWTEFKSQKFYGDMNGFLAHCPECRAPIKSLLSIKMMLSETEVSLIDFCKMADEIISKTNDSVRSLINRGKTVLLNSKFTMCMVTDDSEYEFISDINKEQMINFFLHRDINYKLQIDKPNVFIRNSNYISKNGVQEFCDMVGVNENDIQFIDDFKRRTLLFREEDFVQFFSEGIANLKTIFVRLYDYDYFQIIDIKNSLTTVLENVDKKINLAVIDCYERDRHLFDFANNNINIKFLGR